MSSSLSTTQPILPLSQASQERPPIGEDCGPLERMEFGGGDEGARREARSSSPRMFRSVFGGVSRSEIATQKKKFPLFVPCGAPPGMSLSEEKYPGGFIRIHRPHRKLAAMSSDWLDDPMSARRLRHWR